MLSAWSGEQWDRFVVDQLVADQSVFGVDPSMISMPQASAADLGFVGGLYLRQVAVPVARADDAADADAKKPKPAPSERSWLVEGPRADVEKLMQRVAAFARRSGYKIDNGEVAGVVPSPSRQQQPSGADAASARVLLRFRTLPRK